MWKDGPNGKKYPNSFEPADCLVEWAAEMKEVDQQIQAAADQDFLKPVKAANAAREQAAKEKAAKLMARREQLLRRQRRQQRGLARGEAVSDDSEGGEEESEEESEEERDGEADLPTDAAALTVELLANLLARIPASCLARIPARAAPRSKQQRRRRRRRLPQRPAAAVRSGRSRGGLECGWHSTGQPTPASFRTRRIEAKFVGLGRAWAQAPADTSHTYRSITVQNGPTS